MKSEYVKNLKFKNICAFTEIPFRNRYQFSKCKDNQKVYKFVTNIKKNFLSLP